MREGLGERAIGDNQTSLLRNAPLPNPPRKGEGFKLSVLKKRPEFLAVAAAGKKWTTPAFILQIAPATGEASPVIRYGLTASSKVGNAVVRNRCRRRLRALANEILPQHASSGYWYVLIARGTAAKHDYTALKKDLLWALKRIGALREP